MDGFPVSSANCGLQAGCGNQYEADTRVWLTIPTVSATRQAGRIHPSRWRSTLKRFYLCIKWFIHYMYFRSPETPHRNRSWRTSEYFQVYWYFIDKKYEWVYFREEGRSNNSTVTTSITRLYSFVFGNKRWRNRQQQPDLGCLPNRQRNDRI